jgi:MFS family permease
LYLGIFLNKFGTFVLPFLSIHMIRQGFSVKEAGLVMGCYGAGHLCASLLGGYCADKLGRRHTIVLSMFSVSLAMIALWQSSTLPALMISTALVGLTGELYRPASSALLADLIPSKHRLIAYAVYRLAFNAGWAFAPAVAGFLAEKSFQWLFLGDALTSVLFGLVAWFSLPNSAPTTAKESSWTDLYRSATANPPFLRLLISAVAVAFVYVQILASFGVEITSKGISSSVFGLLMSLNGLLVVLFEVPLTFVTRRYPAKQVISTGFVLIGVGFGLTSVLSRGSVALYALVILLFTLGEMISMPTAIARVADVAPESLRGRYMGLYGLGWSSAMVFGPGLGMVLFDIHPALLWGACAVLGILAGLIVLFPEKVRKPQVIQPELCKELGNTQG